MAYVYILESQKNGKYYVGSTKDINQRLLKHKKGGVHTTKRFLPVKLVFKQEYSDIRMAENIEYRLKKMKRKDYLRKIIQNGVIKLK